MSRTTTVPARYAGAAALALGTLLAGCGSSGTAASSPSSTAGGSTGVGASAPTSTAAPTSTTPTATASLLAGGGGSFCTEARAENGNAKELNAELDVTDPAKLKAVISTFYAIVQQFESEAPAQIKPSVVILVNGDEVLFKQLASVGYDYTKLSPTTLTTLTTPAFLAASKTVASYLSSTCHIAPGT